MFDSLSTRLQDVFKTLRGEARLTPENIEAALREIRLALLEADVNFKVVKAFIDRVRDRAMGQDVLRQPVAVAAGRQDRPRRDGGALRRRRRRPAADDASGRASCCCSACRARARRRRRASWRSG